MTEEHHMLYDSASRFFKEQWAPKDEAWRAAGMMDREAWNEAGAHGFLCASMPQQYGGAGGDFGHEAVLILAQGAANVSGFGGSLHSGIVAPYILHHGTEEQKQRWLPKMATGELIGAIAMTEPGTGSDLQAIRTSAKRGLDGAGDHYVLNGQKTFITNGGNANLIIVACRTGGEGSKGMSLLVVETEHAQGFRRGRLLDKIGMKSQDTAELFFNAVKVPKANQLGEAGKGREALDLLDAVSGEVAGWAAELRRTIVSRWLPAPVTPSSSRLPCRQRLLRVLLAHSPSPKPLPRLPMALLTLLPTA